MKSVAIVVAVLALLLTACGGETEFNAMDAQGLADIVDAGVTEDSGLKGIVTADVFSEEDVAEFNDIAEDACADLSNGISAEEYAEFESGVTEGADDLDGLIDPEALAVAMVEATCPSYVGNLQEAIAG